MPLSVFKDLGLNGLERTSICIQLVDWSFISSLGVVEDGLFPANFYIIEMNNEFARTSPTILLGRPFLKTAKAVINVDKGLLSVEFDGDVVSFNIFDDIKSSNDHASLCALDTLESLETLEEQDKLNELIDQVTLEYVDNEFSKEKPSDDDLWIFLDFVTSINDEHALVDNVTTHKQHALGNNFASSKELDLERHIKDEDEQTLKDISIVNEQDPSIHIRKLKKENDLENGPCEVYLHKECENFNFNSNSNELTLHL